MIVTSLASYGIWLFAAGPIKTFFHENDARVVGAALVVIIAAAAGMASMAARQAGVRNLLISACAVGTVMAMARDSAWNIGDAQVQESSALVAGSLAAILVAAQRWCPKVVAALALVVVAVWTIVGLLSPYPHAVADAERAWLVLAGAALGTTLARPR